VTAMAEMAADVSVVEKSTDAATTASKGGDGCVMGSGAGDASGSMFMVYGLQMASVVGVGCIKT
jgi:hypothetical protein